MERVSDKPEKPHDPDAPVFEFAPRRHIANRKDDGPQPIGQLLMPTLSRLGLKTRARHLQIMGLWPAVVGEAVAVGAHPTAYDRGRLVVETDSPALGHQLHLQRQTIIDQLNAAIGERVVTQIRFKLQAGT
ncbi:MAG TPA: DUF721 domain-containing protein [Candidatus Dormibacteraeota bacterium]|nr:DUF721 domain-containing protein [Candidatus Dormibacteraeota bacterium]